MKITDIQTHVVQAPGRTLVIILVKTDEGITGVGEAGLQRRWKAIEGAIEHIKRWLLGEDPMRTEHIWQRIARGGFYPSDRLIGSALSGIDIALWDIKGQVLGVPVYELLGGRCRNYVECFFQPGYLSQQAEHPQEAHQKEGQSLLDSTNTVALAKRYIDEGYKFLRLSPRPEKECFDSWNSIRELVEQLQNVRSAVGDKLELMIDLHTRLNPAEAIWFCRACEDLRLYVVEDPIRSEHLAGYRHIRQHTNVPLAAGEQWAGKWEFRQAIEEELIDYARVDVCIAGGITEAKKIAAMAETHLIQMLFHNPLGPVCTAASLHLDLSIDNAGPQELLWLPQEMLPDVFECDFKVEQGKLTVPAAPGLGIRFDAEAAKKYPGEMTEPPHWHRPDGSFTNY